MGLLKAADVEYISSAPADEEIYESYETETVEDAASDEARGYIPAAVFDLATPVVIGGEGMDLDFAVDLDAIAYDDDTVFFASTDTEVVFATPVTIGGAAPISHQEPEEYYATDDAQLDDYQQDYQQDYSEDTWTDDSFTDESFTDESLGEFGDEEFIEEEPVDDAASALEGFSSLSQQDVGDDPGAENWANQQRTSMITRLDDKVRDMMREQTDAMKAQSAEQISFVSAEEKNRLVSEALETIQDSPLAEGLDFEKIFQDIADYIENLAWHHTEKLQQDLEEEREQMLRNVEEYVENSINEQREQMMEEAQNYISETVSEYKKSLTEDNEFIKAANNIISQREQILDEAYNKSLQMVQEAEEQAQQIMEDAYAQQEQANQMIQEAEAQVEMIAQEAQAEAERIISEANMESARIIEAAEQSHQEIVEAATQDGFNVGYQEGREEAIKENAQLLMETTNALNKLHAAFPVAVKQNEDKLIKLALEISREVLQDELQMKPENVLKNVERAIGKVSDLEKVLIKVNPLDLDLVLPKQEYFKNLLPDVQDFIITGHYSIERGGCLIETNSGTVDAQINTQLAVVEEVFQQIRSEYDFDEDDEDEDDEEDEI